MKFLNKLTRDEMKKIKGGDPQGLPCPPSKPYRGKCGPADSGVCVSDCSYETAHMYCPEDFYSCEID
jgi:hypothetical protein